MRLIAIFLTALATLSATAKAEDALQRSPELEVLDRFVGTWDHEFTLKPAEGEAITRKTVDYRFWSRGGTILHFSNPTDDPELHLSLTYDPESKTYPGVMLIGSTRATVTATWEAKKQTMSFAMKYADGNKYNGVHRFIGKDRAAASGTVTNPDGEVVMKLSWNQRRRDDRKLNEILEKHYEAIGGVEAHRKLSSRKIEGTMSVNGMGEWKLTVLQKAPNLRHVTVAIPDQGVVLEGYDGKVGWKKELGQGTRTFEGAELEKAQREAEFYGSIELKKWLKNLTYVGMEESDSDDVHTLKGQAEGETRVTLYLNAKTHLIDRMTMPVPGIEQEMSIQMKDYRTADGIKLPFSNNIVIGDSFSMFLKFNKVTHGVEIDDSIFAAPK